MLGMICLVLGISCAWFVVIAFVIIIFGLAFVTKVFVVNGLWVASFCNKKFVKVMSYICSYVKCMSSP